MGIDLQPGDPRDERPDWLSQFSYRQQAFIIRSIVYLVLSGVLLASGFVCHQFGCIGKRPAPVVKGNQ